MKIAILLFLLTSLLFSDEHRLLLTGFAFHEKEHDDNGNKLNGENYGVGYEYTTFEDYGEMYFSGSASVLRDSYKNPEYTLTFSPNWRYKISQDFDWSIGVAAFVTWKKDAYNFRPNSPNDGDYELLPGAAPLASLYYKDVSINLTYIPSIEYGNLNIVGFAFVYFSWKIN
jgi:hypothetical protein